ncbi:hypothetical protein, partial [Gluconobacter cerinus]|uniref:hypothetical protein n=1 Tax=Gluconobacter cerinus TaxID=38307 RepID=UPI00223064D7
HRPGKRFELIAKSAQSSTLLFNIKETSLPHDPCPQSEPKADLFLVSFASVIGPPHGGCVLTGKYRTGAKTVFVSRCSKSRIVQSAKRRSIRSFRSLRK